MLTGLGQLGRQPGNLVRTILRDEMQKKQRDTTNKPSRTGKKERVSVSLNVDPRTRLLLELLSAVLDKDRGSVLDIAVGDLAKKNEEHIRKLPDLGLELVRNRAA